MEAKLRKRKKANFELRSLVRSLREKMKSKDREIVSLSEQVKGLEEEKAAIVAVLDVVLSDLNWVKEELEQSRVCFERLNLLERKANHYPFKKRKIYQGAIDIATLTEKERMKRLIYV